MRVLWISYYKSWIFPLLEGLSKKCEIAMIVPSDIETVEKKDGVSIYKIKIPQNDSTCNMTQSVAERYCHIVKTFCPDIIHVHGTERNLAQIQNFIKGVPVVISIQGILSGCLPYDTGYLRGEDVLKYKTLKNVLGRGGLFEMHNLCKHGSVTYEHNILKNGKYFFCRTNWDKAWVMFSNPLAKIYQGEELLRQPFYDKAGTWNVDNCVKHRIFMLSGFNSIKGLHIALKATFLLKKFYADVQLVVPGLQKHILAYEGLKARLIGEEFINYCKDIIRKNDIKDNVILLDRLDAEEMATQIQKANVFLSPSSIDNSPNSVGEAMMIGCPVVCSPVGGTTSFLKDEENSLLAPAGDEFITAYQIKRVFDDVDLSFKLGRAAHVTALRRHDKKNIVMQYIDSYKDIIEKKDK